MITRDRETFLSCADGYTSDSLRTNVLKVWDSSCSRPDETISTGPEGSTLMDVSPEVVFRVNAEVISSDNPMFLTFGNCLHIKKGYTTDTDLSRLVVHGSYDIVTLQEFEDCTSAGWIFRRQDGSHEIDIRCDPLTLGAAPIEKDLSSIFMDHENVVSLRDDLSRAAMSHFIPRLEDGFSLPVFIFELKDVPSLVGSLVKTLSSLPGWFLSLLRRPLNEISSSILAADFGWLPLIRDCKVLATKLLRCRQVIDDFIESSGKRRTFHWSCELDPSDYKPGSFFSSDAVLELNTEKGEKFEYAKDIFTKISIPITQAVNVENFSYHATCDYAYRIPDYGRLTRALAALDVFGINLSVSDLWEIVPFSFVVDWFVNVGNMLKRFDFVNLPVEVEIYDFCDSITFELTQARLPIGNITVDLPDPTLMSSWTVTPGFASFLYKEHAYYRWRRFPSLPAASSLEVGLPRGWSILNGLALLGQRARR